MEHPLDDRPKLRLVTPEPYEPGIQYTVQLKRCTLVESPHRDQHIAILQVTGYDDIHGMPADSQQDALGQLCLKLAFLLKTRSDELEKLQLKFQ